MELAYFGTYRLKDLAGFPEHHDFEMHTIQGSHILWHGLLFSDGRNVCLELNKDKKHIFYFEDLVGFAISLHK